MRELPTKIIWPFCGVMVSKLDVQLQPGDRVGTTQWTVVKPLGRGTYGFVYECVHETLQRRAAVKILKRKSGVVAKLSQEKALSAARLLVTFRHPNLPEVYDAQVLKDGDGLPRMWTAMELLEGEELAERLSAGPLTVEQSLRYVLQVAKPLAALDDHSGVIHRDIKPANIFITTDDVVKVLDFDTARLRGAGTVSGSGKAVGSPYYMSPESWRDHNGIDRRVDVWSLGVVLYQCLSGELPFVASNVYKLMQVIEEKPPRSLAKKVGQDVWHIVARALQVDRRQRWPNMHEFAAVIERVRDMHGWDSREIKSVKSLMEGDTLDDQEAVSRHVLNSEKRRRTSSSAGDGQASDVGPDHANKSTWMAATTPLDAAPPAPAMAATLVLEAAEPAPPLGGPPLGGPPLGGPPLGGSASEAPPLGGSASEAPPLGGPPLGGSALGGSAAAGATSGGAMSEKETTLESASATSAGGVWLKPPASDDSQPVKRHMRSRWRLVAVLVVLVVVVVVGLVMVLRRGHSAAVTAPSAVTVKESRPTAPSASAAPSPAPTTLAPQLTSAAAVAPSTALPAPMATPLPVKKPTRPSPPTRNKQPMPKPQRKDKWL